MATRGAWLLAIVCLFMSCANAYVTIDSNRLAAEMKYWACSPEGETADTLLHVMAEKTIRESTTRKAPVTCATWDAATKAVRDAIASHAWKAPAVEDGHAKSWAGCAEVQCPTQKGTSLKMETGTYIRLLEFGHEQASSCSKGANAAIDAFVAKLANAGCANRVCTIVDYTAARPTTAAGCAALF